MSSRHIRRWLIISDLRLWENWNLEGHMRPFAFVRYKVPALEQTSPIILLIIHMTCLRLYVYHSVVIGGDLRDSNEKCVYPTLGIGSGDIAFWRRTDIIWCCVRNEISIIQLRYNRFKASFMPNDNVCHADQVQSKTRIWYYNNNSYYYYCIAIAA